MIQAGSTACPFAEYMAGGSLKSALGRKADIVAGALTRVVLALDAAKGLEYLHSKVGGSWLSIHSKMGG